MNSRTNVTDREISEWQDLKLAGYTNEEIAKIYNRSRSTVAGYTLPVLTEYILYHQERFIGIGTLEEIAQQSHYAPTTIKSYLSMGNRGERGFQTIKVGRKVKDSYEKE